MQYAKEKGIIISGDNPCARDVYLGKCYPLNTLSFMAERYQASGCVLKIMVSIPCSTCTLFLSATQQILLDDTKSEIQSILLKKLRKIHVLDFALQKNLQISELGSATSSFSSEVLVKMVRP